MSTNAEQELLDLVHRVRSVRTWLVWLILSRTLAICLAFVAFYVLGFSMLDHRFQFGPAGRFVALVILLAGVVATLIMFGRAVGRCYSTRQAANFVESHCRFEQQLATAIEYYEDRDDYPYSERLAQRVVKQAAASAREVDFTSAVPKWQVHVSMAVIVVGLVLSLAAFLNHSAYFASYFARLMNPMAAVAPLSLTQLETITGVMVVAEGQRAEFAARVVGRVPDSGLLEFEAYKDTEERSRHSAVEVTPVGSEEEVRLSSVAALPTGRYAYRFTAADAATPWQDVTVAPVPQLARVEAQIQVGPETPPYTAEVRESTLEVPAGSHVELRAELTEAITSAVVTGLDGKQASVAPRDPTHFEYPFQATQNGLIIMSVASAAGLDEIGLTPLQVMLVEDAGPEFSLKTPKSDYLATNVASIPIAMEVRDDTGLGSAALVIEIPNVAPVRVDAALEPTSTSTVLTHTLELENYELEPGDAIVYHAEAEGRPVDATEEGKRGASDLYFIEIKPYRQIWHQVSAPMPSDFGKPGMPQGEGYRSLLALLEYTRAILKKTWPLANAEPLSASDADNVQSILKDVQYVQQQTSRIVTDLRSRMTAEQAQTLEQARDQFKVAAGHLENQDPKQAIPPETAAYKRLRSVTLELEKGMMPAGGGSLEDRDRLRLEEEVHLTRFEEEEEQWQLERLSDELEQLRDEQKRLKEEFAHFLKDYGQQESSSQETADERSWRDASARQPEETSQTTEEGGGEQPRVTVEGALPPTSSGSGGASAQSEARHATAQERLDVLRATQRALQAKADSLREDLENRGGPEAGDSDDTERAAQMVGEAANAMAAFDSAATDAMFSAKPDAAFDQAESALAGSAQALQAAAFALDQAALLTAQEEAAKQLEAQAEQMSDLARSFGQPMTSEEREALIAQLQKAIVTFQEQGGPQYVEHFGGRGVPPSYIALTHSIVAPADKSNIAKWVDTEPERAATWLAAQYSTLALEVQKQRGALRQGERSDASFAPMENTFYEEAARYDGGLRR